MDKIVINEIDYVYDWTYTKINLNCKIPDDEMIEHLNMHMIGRQTSRKLSKYDLLTVNQLCIQLAMVQKKLICYMVHVL